MPWQKEAKLAEGSKACLQLHSFSKAKATAIERATKSLTDVVESAVGALVGSDERLLHKHLKDLLYKKRQGEGGNSSTTVTAHDRERKYQRQTTTLE